MNILYVSLDSGKHQVGKEKWIEEGKEISETEEGSKKRTQHRSKYKAVVLTEILICQVVHPWPALVIDAEKFCVAMSTSSLSENWTKSISIVEPQKLQSDI